MALTKIGTDGFKDDAVTTDKLANAINTERTANTAKVSLGADSVTGAKIADDAVGAEHIEQLDADLSFADSAKAKFGAGNDLEIYHDGTNNQIKGIGGHPLLLHTNDTQRVVLQTDGHLRPSSNDTYDLGTSSDRWRKVYTNGVLFNGDTAAANALDDYETGTWTPVFKKYVSGSWVNATMTTAGSTDGCYYVKIGNIVHFHLGLSGFEIADSNYAVIGGLPHTRTGRGSVVVNYATVFNSHQNQAGHLSGSGDLMEFYHTGNSWNAFNNNTSGLYIYADGWYQAA